MSENRAQNFLRSALITGPHDRMDRVENVLVDGMPDVNACVHGYEFWIENKQPKEPKREDTPLFGSNHKFSQEQMNWFLKQRQAGGFAFAFVWTDKRGILLTDHQVQIANQQTVIELIDDSIWHGVKPVHAIHRAALRSSLLAYLHAYR